MDVHGGRKRQLDVIRGGFHVLFFCPWTLIKTQVRVVPLDQSVNYNILILTLENGRGFVTRSSFEEALSVSLQSFRVGDDGLDIEVVGNGSHCRLVCLGHGEDQQGGEDDETLHVEVLRKTTD
jgi:hypothetical protein